MGTAARTLLVPAIGTVVGTVVSTVLALAVAAPAGAAAPGPDADGYVPPEEPTLTAEVFQPICDGDVPYLRYAVVPGGTDARTVTITWLHPDGEDVVQADLPLSGRVLWPGAVVADDGSPVDWPGWRLEGDEWVVGDEFDWVRPAVDVRFEVNPELTLTATYPPSSPDCATDPPGAPPSSPPSSVPPEPGGTTASPVPLPLPAAVQPPAPPAATTATAGPEALPRTGAQVAGLAALAAALLGAGALALGTARRRRTHH